MALRLSVKTKKDKGLRMAEPRCIVAGSGCLDGIYFSTSPTQTYLIST